MARRDATLPPQDLLFLDGLGKEWEIIVDGSIWVLIYAFTLPPGYSQSEVILAVRIEGGYPMTPLDMMYVYPEIQRTDGKSIVAADVPQTLDQKQFQRWSRHRTPENPWISGQDSLETHYYLIEEAFRSELAK
jgi:hypothetical protein